MAYSFKHKVVLITGAAGGIGAALAQQFYQLGANLVLTDVSLEAVQQQAVAFSPERVLALSHDVTDSARSIAVAEKAMDYFGRLDCVVANAGIAWQGTPATALGCGTDEFERIVAVDFLGVWRTIKACLPEVVRHEGQVVIVSSIYAMINGVANAPYAASKAAVESLARSLRVELAYTGASASVVYPGWTATPIIDIAFGGHALATRMNETALPAVLRRTITPEALAKAVVTGLRKRKAHIIAPARWRPLFWARGVVNPATDAWLAGQRTLQGMLAELDALTNNTVTAIAAARHKRGANSHREKDKA